VSKGLFISFEGTEGSGKSTQIRLLASRIAALGGHRVQTFREPGGTLIGQEIRNTLKHSEDNAAMTAEAELLLMNASRAQLVREVIRPALEKNEIVLCDRFYDSTTAYQGYGRQLDLGTVQTIIDFAVGKTRPHLTILLTVPIQTSETRRLSRREAMLLDVPTNQKANAYTKLPFSEPLRDRMEEADREFFERVAVGYEKISAAEPKRIQIVNGLQPIDVVSEQVWNIIYPILPKVGRW
jgi:dTMP kinase